MDNNRNSSSMIWCRRSTLKLIASLKSKPVLWLPGHKNYLNSSIRMQAHRDIALDLHKLKIVATIPDIRKKIHTLRSQYTRQVKDILDKQRRFGKLTQPALWSFDEMSFLWPICAPDTDMPIFEEPDKNEDDFDMLDNLFEEQIDDTEFEENENISSSTAIEPQQVSNNPNTTSRKTQWTRPLTMKLIELYERNEVLWNPKHSSQDNLQKRKAASNEIAKEMSLFLPGISPFDIQMKLRMLRFQYRKQVQLLEMKKKEGIEILPKLWCFNLLSFLWSFHAGHDDAIHDDDNDGVDYYNELEESAEKEALMNESITESMYNIEALEESDEDELKEFTILEKDDYDDSDNLSQLNTDDLESESNYKSSTHNPKRTVSSSKGRYNWIGTQVVDTLNELENEDVIFDTVVTIENLLHKIRELDKEEKTKSNNKSERPPQRRSNRMRPKLSDFNNFEVSFDLNQLHAKDVSVKVINQTIVIEGELENGYDQDHKQFVRYYDLPNGYDVDSVEATQYQNGLLKVNASKLVRNTMDEIDLPIKHGDKSNLFHNITN